MESILISLQEETETEKTNILRFSQKNKMNWNALLLWKILGQVRLSRISILFFSLIKFLAKFTWHIMQQAFNDDENGSNE